MSVLTMVLIGIVVLCIVAIGAVGDRIRELEDKIESVSSCFKKKASKSLVEGRFKRLESLAKNTDQRLADTIRKLDEFQTKMGARIGAILDGQEDFLKNVTDKELEGGRERPATARGLSSLDLTTGSMQSIPIPVEEVEWANENIRRLASLIYQGFGISSDEDALVDLEERILAECASDRNLLAEVALAEWVAADVRGAAARLYFSHVPPENRDPDLVASLAGADRAIVRHGVVLGLAEGAEEQALRSFESDPDPLVREEAGLALAEFGGFCARSRLQTARATPTMTN